LASAVFAAQKAFQIFQMVVSPLINILGMVRNAVLMANTAMAGWLLPIALLTVAVHDLWEVAHGRPGWVQQFIDFLGIGQQVQDVFFGIFDAVDAVIGLLKDLFTLKFGKFFSDAAADMSSVASAMSGIAAFAGKVGGGIVHTLVPGLSGAQNLSAAAALPGAGPVVPGAPGGQPVVSGGNQINTQITVNAAPGMNTNELAQQVADKHQEHMNRTLREASRSLRSQTAY
jgi:hypothetical protein